MHLLVPGGSGILGTAICRNFLKLGHQVTCLSRKKSKVNQAHSLIWDGQHIPQTLDQLQQTNPIDVIINLCGETIAQPWFKKTKQRLINSRVIPTQALADWASNLSQPIGLFIQASGIDYYPVNTSIKQDESCLPGDSFLSQLCQQWEAGLSPLANATDTRCIIARLAPVFSGQGGMLAPLLLTHRLMLGNYISGLDCSMNWIHIDDVMGLINHWLTSKDSGVFNVCSPQVIGYQDFVKALSQATQRPAWIPTPQAVIRLLLGEASTLLLDSHTVEPKRILETTDYSFLFTDAFKALQHLAKPSSHAHH